MRELSRLYHVTALTPRLFTDTDAGAGLNYSAVSARSGGQRTPAQLYTLNNLQSIKNALPVRHAPLTLKEKHHGHGILTREHPFFWTSHTHIQRCSQLSHISTQNTKTWPVRGSRLRHSSLVLRRQRSPSHTPWVRKPRQRSSTRLAAVPGCCGFFRRARFFPHARPPSGRTSGTPAEVGRPWGPGTNAITAAEEACAAPLVRSRPQLLITHSPDSVLFCTSRPRPPGLPCRGTHARARAHGAANRETLRTLGQPAHARCTRSRTLSAETARPSSSQARSEHAPRSAPRQVHAFRSSSKLLEDRLLEGSVV